MTYEIAVERNNKYGYNLNYSGPWSTGVSTFYDDFKEALDLIEEWGRNKNGMPRKTNRIGIYDHEDDKFYTQRHCLCINMVVQEENSL